MKDGYKTTEFWLTIASVLLGLIENVTGINLPKEPLYTILGYVFSRGWVKAVNKNVK